MRAVNLVMGMNGMNGMNVMNGIEAFAIRRPSHYASMETLPDTAIP